MMNKILVSFFLSAIAAVACAQNKDGSAFTKPLTSVRAAPVDVVAPNLPKTSAPANVALGSYMQYPSAQFSSEWAAQREAWNQAKMEKLGDMQQLPKMERLKTHYGWLVYLNPSNPYYQYFKLEEQFFIALEAQEWDSTRTHATRLWNVLEQFPEEGRLRAKLAYYALLQSYPEDAIGGDYLWRGYITQMERENRWLDLAQYFMQEQNPRRSLETSLNYVRKHTQNMNPLEAYKFERTWLLRLDPSEQGVWYRENETKPWMAWWWITQYHAFCQSRNSILPVNSLGLPSGDACVSR